MLEAAIAQNTKSAAIYRFLGDTYRYVGLNRLAEERYLRGITLAQTTGDSESEEAMQDNLKIVIKITRATIQGYFILNKINQEMNFTG